MIFNDTILKNIKWENKMKNSEKRVSDRRSNDRRLKTKEINFSCRRKNDRRSLNERRNI